MKDYFNKEIAGINVYYKESGEGYPLFLIPPWTASNMAFDGLVELLKDYPIKIIRPDLPGWGGKTKQKLEDKSFGSYVEFISDFINSFGFKKYAVLGYSLGNTFLLHAIAKKLINPEKLIIISGFHSRSNVFEVECDLNRNLKIYYLTRKLRIPKRGLKFILANFYLYEMIVNDIYRRKYRYFTRLVGTSIFADFDSVMEPMLTLEELHGEQLKDYKGKSLVLYNSKEPWYFVRFTQEIADMLGVKPVTIEAFSHRHFSFEPERSYDITRDFILR
ncbi:MAG: alpha/beta hydrolase family protein [candidate division WS6 bacterium GW2011_GWF2_39_15]|uniref:Alpha/beta hydrolase family protein n=1 Tax=candidate division WS6 bacterium GW2011_GWF2_39_15 TaxID=1619100 RepID=A0A0G0Q7H1_9BACT|nr:MAG: alpha/beta hydrolase family protein [candidate division WS6 bacterium GW2011_GWF2_39_15]